eukprot:6190360-Pleurochrysis_carterae.AAC.1
MTRQLISARQNAISIFLISAAFSFIIFFFVIPVLIIEILCLRWPKPARAMLGDSGGILDVDTLIAEFKSASRRARVRPGSRRC